MPKKTPCDESEYRIHVLEKELGEAGTCEAKPGTQDGIRQLLDFAPYGMFLIDLSGKIVAANLSGVEHLGKSFPEVIGTTLHEYFPSSAADHVRTKGMEVVKTGRPESFEMNVDDIWYSQKIAPVSDSQGKITHLAIYGMDITEFKLKEKALRKSKALLSELTGQVPGVLYQFYARPNGEMGLYYVSERSESIFGIKPDVDGFFERFSEMMIPEHRKAFYKSIEKAVKEKSEWHYEGIVRKSTGERIRFSGHSVPTIRATEIVFNGIVQDITESRRNEHARLADLKFFENMDKVNRAIQQNNDPEQMMSDVLDVVLSVFQCDRAWLGYPCDPEAATWLAPMERTRPEYPGAFALGLEVPMDSDVVRVYKAALASNDPVGFGPGNEHPLPEKVAERFYHQSQLSVAIYPKIDKPYLFGIHQCSRPRPWSQEERKLLKEIGRRMEDALTMLLMYRNLQHSEERYRALFRNNPIDTVIVDNDAKIVMFNLAKEKTGELLPNIGDVMYKDYADKHTINMFEELMECMKSGDTKEFSELKYKKRFLHVRISPFSGGAIITSIDISEKKKQENERLKMEKLESVGLLAGGIAHDFNNVLTAILGNVSMAKDQVMPGDEVFDLLNEAETASKRARTLTKQLLTFAKGGTPVKETASISDILKEGSLFATRGSKSRCELSIAAKFQNLCPRRLRIG